MIGKTIFECLSASNQWQSGGNINLGSLTLIIPLICAYIISQKNRTTNQSNIRKIIRDILRNTTVQDSIYFYDCVNLAKPGGIKYPTEKYDITNKNYITEVKKDKKTLYDLLKISSKWDSISKEWITSYEITFNLGAPTFTSILNETKDINIATVHTFLKILGSIPDSLIMRKNNIDISIEISKKASEVLKLGGLLNPNGKNKLVEFDKYLQMAKGKLNPGSSADLTCSSIMVALLNRDQFPSI
jgi:triphosphoribosyl-dephospho-CoA synthase